MYLCFRVERFAFGKVAVETKGSRELRHLRFLAHGYRVAVVATAAAAAPTAQPAAAAAFQFLALDGNFLFDFFFGVALLFHGILEFKELRFELLQKGD